MLEAKVLDYHGTNGATAVLDEAVFAKRAERRFALEIAIGTLTTMYHYKKMIEERKKPKLDITHVVQYGNSLEEFKRAMHRHWLSRAHSELIPKIEEAYKVICAYVLNAQNNGKGHNGGTDQLPQIINWLKDK